MIRSVRAVLRNHGRYAAAAPLAARPLVAGGALGTAVVVAVLIFSSSSHADISPSNVGSSAAAARPATASAPQSAGLGARLEPQVPHFDAATAMAAMAENAAANQAAALAELDEAPDAGTVPTAVVDAAQILTSGFVKPVDGVLSSQFGIRFHPILHVWKLHSGTDLAAACGTPVKAAKAGTVTMAGGFTGYGNRVVIDHGSGVVTTYNHLTSYAAAVGLKVQQGQIIGYVGSTGMSTGCHLHFEVMVGGAFVDPAPYLDLAPAPKVVIPAAVPPRSDIIPSPATGVPTTSTPTTTSSTTTSSTTTSVTDTPGPTTVPTATATDSPTDVPTGTAGPSTTSDPTATSSDPSTTSDASTTSEPTASTSTTTPADPVEPSPTATDPASP